jgi:hypothetical protein
MERNSDLVLSDFTLNELIFNGTSPLGMPKASRLSKDELEALSWMVNAMAWRRLISTDQGRMGLCIAAARMGDRVAIILGCDMPILMRPKDDGLVLVGESYLYGIMSGEALAKLGGEAAITVDIKFY